MKYIYVTLFSILLFGCDNTDIEGGPYSKTDFGKWQWNQFTKCRYIIKGEVEWRNNKNELYCWYHGKIVFEDKFK